MSEAPVSTGTSAFRTGAALGGIVLAAVVVFSLGVMVGKRVAESVPAVAAPPSALPTETLPPLPQAAIPAAAIPPEKLTFYDRLSGAASTAPTAVPQALPFPQPEAKALVPLPQALPFPQPQTQEPVAATSAVSAKPAAPAASKAPAKAAPNRNDAAAQIRKLAGKGNFAVQVAAVNERAAAEETAARVKGLGFEALTVMASVKGKIWYRIRVGSFPSKRSAAQAATIFHSAYGLNAIAVQD